MDEIVISMTCNKRPATGAVHLLTRNCSLTGPTMTPVLDALGDLYPELGRSTILWEHVSFIARGSGVQIRHTRLC